LSECVDTHSQNGWGCAKKKIRQYLRLQPSC
jgi:hypothetical protein